MPPRSQLKWLTDCYRKAGMVENTGHEEPYAKLYTRIKEPGTFFTTTLSAVLQARKYFIRYLLLPRPYWLRKRWFSSEPDKATGKYHPARAIAHPWYIAPSVYSRWGPMAWITWLSGKPLPGDGGDKYEPEGYLLAEVGPSALKGKGGAEMKGERMRVEKLNMRVGCPFAKW